MTITRHLPIVGYQDQHGHSEITFDQVRVPVANRLAVEGDGFIIAQARLGPGRFTTPCGRPAWRCAPCLS